MSNQVSTPLSGSAEPSLDGRLDSWKEIAAYLRREVRTVQRWEKSAGLPVHRLQIGKQAPVYAYKAELDAWYSDCRPELESDATDQDERSLFDIRRIRPWAVVVAAVLIAMLSVGAYLARNNSFFRLLSVPPKIKLAVLPFADLSADPDQKYFSAGLTDELITQLGRVNPQHLGVIAATSSQLVVGKPIKEIGRALNVQYVLEGSVRRGGTQFRIDVQLIVVDDQTHVWSNSFTRDASDILRVQSEVATDVARQIEGALPVGLPKPPQVNPVAHDAYLRGRFSSNRQNFLKSIWSFNEALGKDPNYALAYAGLAAAYVLRGLSPNDEIPRSEANSVARLAAQHALDLDPNLPEAHAVMANISMSYDWDFKTAEQEYRRAIELDPNEPTAHQWYGHLLAVEGRYKEAITEVRRAIDIDPIWPVSNTILAEDYYLNRRYDEAVNQARRTIDSSPKYWFAYFWLGAALREKKMYGEAIEAFRHGRDLSDGNPAMIALYGHAQGIAGNPAEARAALHALEQMRASRLVPSIYLAAVHLGLGETSQTFDLLEQAYQERNDRLIYLGVDPIVDPLRGDPRFKQLLLKIGIKE